MKGSNHYRKAEELAEAAERGVRLRPDTAHATIALAHLHLRLAEVAAENAGANGWERIRSDS